MKQHITIEQLKEISTSTLSKIINVDEKIIKHSFDNEEIGYYQNEITNYADKITIGKMLELLTLDVPLTLAIDKDEVIIISDGHLKRERNNLCDSLWNYLKTKII